MRGWFLSLSLAVVLPSVALAVGDVGAKTKEKKKDKEAPKEAEPVGQITWKVSPDDVVIFLDGKKLGTAAKAAPQRVKPGMHVVKLVWGKDEAEEPVNVPVNQSIEFVYTFEDSGKDGTPQPSP